MTRAEAKLIVLPRLKKIPRVGWVVDNGFELSQVFPTCEMAMNWVHSSRFRHARTDEGTPIPVIRYGAWV